MNAVRRWLGWALPATPPERAAALWSFAYFFTLLAGYYVLRPLRDQMGIAGGVKNLPWLFTATFVTLIVAQPAYGVGPSPMRSSARDWLRDRRRSSSIASPPRHS
jgi:ATP:ADP antiporter, AAA family